MAKRKKHPVPIGAGGSCRKLMRSVAHAKMTKNEIQSPNRKFGSPRKSFFARYWRDFVTL